MKNVKFKECNVVFAKDQKGYKQLDAFYSNDTVITCWNMSIKDRIKALFVGKLWLGQITFGNSLQPQLPSINKSDLIINK